MSYEDRVLSSKRSQSTESEWSQKQRAKRESQERERLEHYLQEGQEDNFSDDPDVHRELYELYKAKFAASAIRSDARDIRTIEYTSKKVVVNTQHKGRGRYLAEVPHPQRGYEKY